MLGERLAELRKDHKMKQKDLAELLSLGTRVISDYEMNHSDPSDSTKIKIAQIFNVSLDYLMGLTREQRPFVDDSRMALFPACFEAEDVEMAHAFLAFLKERRMNKNAD